MTNFVCFFALVCPYKQTKRATYPIDELMKDSGKINTLSQLDSDSFSISDVIMIVKFECFLVNEP